MWFRNGGRARISAAVVVVLVLAAAAARGEAAVPDAVCASRACEAAEPRPSARHGYGKTPPLHAIWLSSVGSTPERQQTAIAQRDVPRARAAAAAPSTIGVSSPAPDASRAAAATRALAALQRRAEGVYGDVPEPAADMLPGEVAAAVAAR